MNTITSLYTKVFLIRLITATLFIYIGIEGQSQNSINVPLELINKKSNNIKVSTYMHTEENKLGFRIPTKDYSEFILKKYILNYGQSLYFGFLAGNLTRVQFDSLILLNHIDTLHFSKSIDNSTLYVLCKKINIKEYLFIPDLNFNKDFTDDGVLQYELGKGAAEFDIILEGTLKNNKTKYTIYLEINSDKVLIDGKLDPFPLFINHSNSFSGSFTYKNKKYLIEIFPPFFYEHSKKGDFLFIVSEKNNKPGALHSKKIIKAFNELYEIGSNRFKISSFDIVNLKVTISVI